MFWNVSRLEQYIHHSFIQHNHIALFKTWQRIQRIFFRIYMSCLPLSLSLSALHISFVHILQWCVFVSVEIQFMLLYHSAVHLLDFCCCSPTNNNISDVKTVERMHFTVGSQSAGKEILGLYEWWCVPNMIKCGIFFVYSFLVLCNLITGCGNNSTHVKCRQMLHETGYIVELLRHFDVSNYTHMFSAPYKIMLGIFKENLMLGIADAIQ